MIFDEKSFVLTVENKAKTSVFIHHPTTTGQIIFKSKFLHDFEEPLWVTFFCRYIQFIETLEIHIWSRWRWNQKKEKMNWTKKKPIKMLECNWEQEELATRLPKSFAEIQFGQDFSIVWWSKVSRNPLELFFSIGLAIQLHCIFVAPTYFFCLLVNVTFRPLGDCILGKFSAWIN